LKIEKEKLDGALLAIAEELDDPPAEAAFGMKNNELGIKDAKRGRIVNQEKLAGEILATLKNFSHAIIKIPLEDITPEIAAADLETVRPQVEEILTHPPKLTYGAQSWTPTPEELLTFLQFQKESATVKVAADESKISEYIKKIATQINREPKGDIFKTAGERVVEFRLAADGLKLNEEEALQLLSVAVLNSTETVALPVEVSQPLRSANDYGIKELLGTGVSNFSGSIQGRINNIQTASAKLRGILIAPGEIFSFNKALGEVSAATGYDVAYIIKEGRTVLGTGGGVCQVSTTVFRTAFNSGLEILARAAHAYRVHYYEPPVGFDATVFDPSPDLVFKNDTGNYLLIWSYVDVPNTTLTFEFYGTADGRTTKMVGPFVSGETPPPAPLYQDDPTLPKGTTQQIDWPAWGADAVLKREVYRAGQILHNDTFTSHYKPWQAVYLVGTRE
jgi:vancomycin resistance protein YoaR